MARAAVRAKQAEAAKAQASKPAPRGRKRHASGGNPNQDLFFSRLRRRQKWVFVFLAVVFAISFAALGVGSGNGGGLEQMYNGIFGNGGDPVAQAQAEIKTDPAKGYMDLANAYLKNTDRKDAIGALESYLGIKKKDWHAWAQIAGLKQAQGDDYAQQYRQIQLSLGQQAPGSIFQPTGPRATILGQNPIDKYYTDQLQAQLSPLGQNLQTAYKDAVGAYQQAAKYATTNDDKALMEQHVASAAQLIGDTNLAIQSLQRYIDLLPSSPFISQIEAQCKQLGGSCKPKNKSK